MATVERMPEPEGPEDERFVYLVTAAGVAAVREGAVVVDSEREADERETASTVYFLNAAALALSAASDASRFLGAS